MDKKALIIKHEWILSRFYRLIGRNNFSIKRGNTVSLNNAFLKRCTFKVVGIGNQITIESGLTRLKNCNITIFGSNCTITIGSRSNLNHCNLYVEDDNGSIIIDQHVTTTGNTDLAVIEGKCIHIGEDCLLSSDISFRVGDSHSILDKCTKKRINPSQDIVIGKHVWIGHSVKLLKGVNIGDCSIVGTGSIVTSQSYPGNSIIAGIPAKVVKQGIDWCTERQKI